VNAKRSGAHVKGLAFRTVMQEFGLLEGPPARERVVEAMPAELGHRFRTNTVSASTWYPIEDYAAMWATIQEMTGNRRDLPYKLGRLAVQHDLNVVHKMIFRALSVPTVIGLATRVFKSYYDTGVSSAEQVSERQIRVSFEGCRGFTAPMWSEIRGSVEYFGEQAAGTKAWSVWKGGAGDRDTHAVLEVSWK
jgi:hypothetical protein